MFEIIGGVTIGNGAAGGIGGEPFSGGISNHGACGGGANIFNCWAVQYVTIPAAAGIQSIAGGGVFVFGLFAAVRGIRAVAAVRDARCSGFVLQLRTEGVRHTDCTQACGRECVLCGLLLL